MLPGLEFNVVACHITAGANGEENEIIAIFNPRANDTVVALPEGEWTVYINADKAGTEPLATVTGEVSVATVSACVLVKAPVAEETVAPTEAKSVIGGADGPTATFVTGGIDSKAIVLCILIPIAVTIPLLSKKRKK